jgi:ribosome-binding protein aMBF1 (putative translation factor)
MARTKNFADVIQAKLEANKVLAEAVDAELVNAEIASQVYEARIKAKLTQKQLADRVNTQQSVICRIEDADYDGHSLNLLKRIARALNVRLRVKLESEQESPVFRVSISYSLNWNPEWQPRIQRSLTVAR